MRTFSFLVTMIITSGLSFVRVAALAFLLDKVEFTDYSRFIALGAFMSMFYSFGIIENTNKLFPKLVVYGQISTLRKILFQIISVLLKRFLVLIILVYLASKFFDPSYLKIGISALLLGLVHSLTSLFASLQRGIGSLKPYAITTAIRSITLFVLIILCAVVYKDFFTLLIVEIIIGIFGVFIAYFFAMKSLEINEHALGSDFNRDINSNSKEGLFLYLSYTLIAIPFYLDRTFVTAVFDEDSAAKYALFALFMTVGTLIINAVTQKIGPEMVKMFSLDVSHKAIIRYSIKWFVLYILFWTLFVISLGLLFQWNYLPNPLRAYQITNNLLFLLLCYGYLNISGLIEYICISFNLERHFFLSSLVYVLALLSVGVIVVSGAYSLSTFIVLLIMVKAAYLFILSLNVFNSMNVR